jgi:hypothetical protein
MPGDLTIGPVKDGKRLVFIFYWVMFALLLNMVDWEFEIWLILSHRAKDSMTILFGDCHG